MKRFWNNRYVSWWIDFCPTDFQRWWPCNWEETEHGTYWMWCHRLGGWFICPRKGHDWYPDMCGRPEHDICERCDIRRDQTSVFATGDANG